MSLILWVLALSKEFEVILWDGRSSFFFVVVVVVVLFCFVF